MHNTILATHAIIKTALHDPERVTPSVLRAVVATLDSLDEALIKAQCPPSGLDQDKPLLHPLRLPTAHKP
jgi:hypothetical protein